MFIKSAFLSCVSQLAAPSMGRRGGGVNGLRLVQNCSTPPLRNRSTIDNVIFRQLMATDARTHRQGPVVGFSEEHRAPLAPIWQAVSEHPEFTLVGQVLGYNDDYFEVWRWRDLDVVFEEADLARVEDTKPLWPQAIHELVLHPNGRLCSTWQPWDGVLGPPPLQDLVGGDEAGVESRCFAVRLWGAASSGGGD